MIDSPRSMSENLRAFLDRTAAAGRRNRALIRRGEYRPQIEIISQRDLQSSCPCSSAGRLEYRTAL
jgi:hypothetical protein